MRTGLLSASLAMAVGVSALPSPQVMAGSLPELAAKLSGEASTLLTDLINGVAKALPAEAFKTQYSHTPVPIEEARAALEHYTFNMSEVIGSGKYDKRQSAQRCANPTIYIEWDRSNDDQRQKYFDAFKCLMSRPPSGQFAASKSRYEDLTALHQTLTPNVHDNGKFLPWHRAFIQLLRRLMHDECGYNGPMIWFDETRYAGRFAQSSLFSSKWLGSLGINGRCVTDGQFANLICNVGPGTSDQPHCLSRNGDGSVTKNCNQEYVDICNQYPDWAGMTRCSFSGVHGFGHNGIGGPMADVQASPCEPFFYFHHHFIDRNARIYTNSNPQWLSQTNGVDAFGNALTLDTKVNTMGMMPDLTIRDLLDTQSVPLCYRYDY
ncbi:hypothetical protein COCC4DRAFT_54796 [Bipolaris maydis ATCC 48331]|uniref:Tyrosinase copper-binding domain-containing protein n=2 Tax=Cochliobolus heterostrophus TaxID=5016 RepID=M2UJ14_COCH5|nr:uncharacterized protein COCC4DRAFT_54796 [Bipolaris maydis ATCC 48331]EMD93666.1 hypothetical protein COCHEDRAFT_1192956 [Bipolaris maydis C5]KAJ5027959.1 hypothetical protein J3E73DRAFT_430812 [Bipolaris maydis]ENH98810.1 hypothetical protein COCC4DRAFT_54796 [Bipolaris maydis ATCC 48331]KAJ5062728.1 hypothetical protein J3E74DRAFT_324152 [Bipolaris maydis]KAJ6198997.1 hypothetical protein J3E72DRAFT_239526 [Bipolaris maydis]